MFRFLVSEILLEQSHGLLRWPCSFIIFPKKKKKESEGPTGYACLTKQHIVEIMSLTTACCFKICVVKLYIHTSDMTELLCLYDMEITIYFTSKSGSDFMSKLKKEIPLRSICSIKNLMRN